MTAKISTIFFKFEHYYIILSADSTNGHIDMTRLSVNINKIATIRNARGGNMPDVQKAALDCERFGAEGITVHPRPDERHIRYEDVRQLRPIVTTEFNIEGNPIPSFIELVLANRPDQVTLVPDAHNAITSNAGWDTISNREFLTDICAEFKKHGIRTSIFVDPDPKMAEAAALCGCDRVELYTEEYARLYPIGPDAAIAPYIATAQAAKDCGLGVNAGHDLNLDNLEFFIRNIPWTEEVSIGHAVICDALYMGLEQTIKAYLSKVRIF
jgi:pyridoxine 5-phosphate synthase